MRRLGALAAAAALHPQSLDALPRLLPAVHIFSSFHASGEQLAQLSGVAALLRFPMPLLSDDPGDSSDDDDDDEAREGVEALRVEGGGGGKRAEPAHILMPS